MPPETPIVATVSQEPETGLHHPAPIVPQPTQASTSPVEIVNKVWTKAIPLTNKIYIGICLIFLLFVDLPILQSSPELAPFFYAMLGAFFTLVTFAVIEHFVGKKLLNNPTNGLDHTIFGFIIVRNIIAVLNVIPFIQIVGLLADFTIIPVIILIEIIILFIRFGQLNKQYTQ